MAITKNFTIPSQAICSGGREREVTSPLDQQQQDQQQKDQQQQDQQLNPKEATLTYGRSKGALLPALNVDQQDHGLYPHKIHISSSLRIYYGSCPIKDLKDKDTPIGAMFAKRKMGRVELSKDMKIRVRGTIDKDKGWNVGHLWDSKYGGTNCNIDNFIVQNAIMNSADGTKSAIDNRFEKQLSSEHSDPAYDVMFICLDSKIEGETIGPGSILRLEHFDPPLLLNDGKEAEWMIGRIYNPPPEEMKIFKNLHPSRKLSECYIYDFGAKNGDEAKLLRELAELLDRHKRPEGNNSIEQLEGDESHKELENLIMEIIKELHTPVADELCQSFELPDGMKKSEGKAVLKALLQAEEPPAVLYIYTSNPKCFAADPEREKKIKEIFARHALHYVRKNIKDAKRELQKWESIEAIAQRGEDTGYVTTESTTNSDDEASPPSDDKAPDVILPNVDETEKQADDELTERDLVFLCMGRTTPSPQPIEPTFSDISEPHWLLG